MVRPPGSSGLPSVACSHPTLQAAVIRLQPGGHAMSVGRVPHEFFTAGIILYVIWELSGGVSVKGVRSRIVVLNRLSHCGDRTSHQLSHLTITKECSHRLK